MSKIIPLISQRKSSIEMILSCTTSQQFEELKVPVSLEKLIELLQKLFRGYHSAASLDGKETLKIFIDICKVFPEWAIAEAVEDFLSGNVENHNHSFCPTTAQLALRTRSKLNFLKEKEELLREHERKILRAKQKREEAEKLQEDQKCWREKLEKEHQAHVEKFICTRGEFDARVNKGEYDDRYFFVEKFGDKSMFAMGHVMKKWEGVK